MSTGRIMPPPPRYGPPPLPPFLPGPAPGPSPSPTPCPCPPPIPPSSPGPDDGGPTTPLGSPIFNSVTDRSCASCGATIVGSTTSSWFGFFGGSGSGGTSCLSAARGSCPSDGGVC